MITPRSVWSLAERSFNVNQGERGSLGYPFAFFSLFISTYVPGVF